MLDGVSVEGLMEREWYEPQCSYGFWICSFYCVFTIQVNVNKLIYRYSMSLMLGNQKSSMCLLVWLKTISS